MTSSFGIELTVKISRIQGNSFVADALGKAISMKVLVTGAGGFIGRHIVEELCEQGHQVRATDLPSGNLSAPGKSGAELVPGDLLNQADVAAMLEGITHVIHCAATFNMGLPVETCLRVNRDATCLLCDEVGKRGVEQFLHMSTGGVYGSSVYTPMREDHPHHPPDAYSLSKEAGEAAVAHRMREFGIPLTIFRPTAVYGPHSTYIAGAFYVVPSILRYYGIRKLPSVKGGKSLTLVHVKDIAGSVSFCLNNEDAFNEDFNLSEDVPLVAGEFFDFLYSLFDIDVAFRVPYPKLLVEGLAKLLTNIPAPVSFGPVNALLEKIWERIVEERGLTMHLKPHFDRDFMYMLLGNHYLDNSKIREIGYESRYPTCIDGLGETIEWYRREGWLP
jgi:nucleoside-diphosphate-sugar epimerase